MRAKRDAATSRLSAVEIKGTHGDTVGGSFDCLACGIGRHHNGAIMVAVIDLAVVPIC